jgi:hypothetical protein
MTMENSPPPSSAGQKRPDPEVVERARRRSFTAEYRMALLDRCVPLRVPLPQRHPVTHGDRLSHDEANLRVQHGPI